MSVEAYFYYLTLQLAFPFDTHLVNTFLRPFAQLRIDEGPNWFTPAQHGFSHSVIKESTWTSDSSMVRRGNRAEVVPAQITFHAIYIQL